MMGFGHVVSTAERLNIWKILLLLLVLVPFVSEFNSSKPHLYTMTGAFLFGLIFPRLRGYGLPSLSLPRLNIARLWQGLKSKLSKKQRQTNASKGKQQQREQAYQKHRQESEQFRQSQTDKGKQRQSQQQANNQNEKIDKEHHQQQHGEPNQADFEDRIRQMFRAGYLSTLGLAPDGLYSQEDIKKAYRKQANNYHPDRHQGKDEETIQAMSDKFAEVKKAYEWLRENES